MKTKVIFVLLTLITMVGFADQQSYPVKFMRDANTQVDINTEYAFIIDRDVAPGLLPAINQVLQQNGLNTVQQLDSLHPFSVFPAGRWVKKNAGPKLTSAKWKQIQNLLPQGAFLTPAYTIGLPSLNSTFAPIPNVLIVDSAIVNNVALLQQLANHQMVFDPEKSKYIFGYAIFKVKNGKANAILIREKLLQANPGIPKLRELLRFENLPLLGPGLDGSGGSGASLRREWDVPMNDWNLTNIHAPTSRKSNNSAIKVGVIDTGCFPHTDLTVLPGVNTMGGAGNAFPPLNNAHGTKVAGIIGAKMNGSTSITGVAPNATIVPLAKTMPLSDVELAAHIGYCIYNGIKIINISLGQQKGIAPNFGSIWLPVNVDPAILKAFQKGTLIAAASGNYQAGTPSQIDYPAYNRYVMAIGSSTKLNKRSADSRYGDLIYTAYRTGVSVVAPGEEVWTTTSTGGYIDFSGTSAAAPHASGLGALLKSTYSWLTNVEIRTIIEVTAEKIDMPRLVYTTMTGFPNGKRNKEVGYGKVNVAGALNLAKYYSVHRQLLANVSIFRFKEMNQANHSVPNAANSIIMEVADSLPLVVPLRVGIFPKGAEIQYNAGEFSGGEGVILEEIEMGLDSNRTVREFSFDPSALQGIKNPGKYWEAVAIADFSLGLGPAIDVRKALAGNRTDLKSLVFYVEDEKMKTGTK